MAKAVLVLMVSRTEKEEGRPVMGFKEKYLRRTKKERNKRDKAVSFTFTKDGGFVGDQ